MTRSRCRLSIGIDFVVAAASDHGVGHALISLLAVRVIIKLSFHVLNLWRHHVNLKGLIL